MPSRSRRRIAETGSPGEHSTDCLQSRCRDLRASSRLAPYAHECVVRSGFATCVPWKIEVLSTPPLDDWHGQPYAGQPRSLRASTSQRADSPSGACSEAGLLPRPGEPFTHSRPRRAFACACSEAANAAHESPHRPLPIRRRLRLSRQSGFSTSASDSRHWHLASPSLHHCTGKRYAQECFTVALNGECNSRCSPSTANRARTCDNAVQIGEYCGFAWKCKEN